MQDMDVQLFCSGKMLDGLKLFKVGNLEMAWRLDKI